MHKDVDIKAILDAWPYDPENNVRVVRLRDGRHVIQVRLPLGIEQYERDGRPDGLRPHGMRSWLDYYIARREEARRGGHEDNFGLDEDDCANLFQEGIVYYYRYLHLFQLQDWRRTIRDTNHNLRLFDFVRKYAIRAEDREYLEQWRPYLIKMNAVATAMLAFQNDEHEKAIQIVSRAVSAVEALPEIDSETFREEKIRALESLRELNAQLMRTRPLSRLEMLEQQLRHAVENEDFERAAELRDRIRSLKNDQTAPQPGKHNTVT
ncbi:MAG: UvrB/UvrC motif-containing protein [Kiritimatiellae bacterium]|nr:UvrB/UvrC motif-containing protein [Kiritimatiellia bacterium]